MFFFNYFKIWDAMSNQSNSGFLACKNNIAAKRPVRTAKPKDAKFKPVMQLKKKARPAPRVDLPELEKKNEYIPALLTRKPDQCCFPTGQVPDKTLRFCTNTKEPLSDYCFSCYKIMYMPRQPINAILYL